jgi:hypothetical protein
VCLDSLSSPSPAPEPSGPDEFSTLRERIRELLIQILPIINGFSVHVIGHLDQQRGAGLVKSMLRGSNGGRQAFLGA